MRVCRACHENNMDMMRTIGVDYAVLVEAALDVDLEE